MNPLNADFVNPPEILFAKVYINHAWGYQHSGWYIDKNGQLYRFDREAEYKLQHINSDTIYTPSDFSKFLHSATQTSRVVPKDTIQTLRLLAQRAKSGKLSDKVSRCDDAGMLAYVAFDYDEKNKYSRPILLNMSGDWAQINQSSAAMKLFEWLRKEIDHQSVNLICGYKKKFERESL